MFVSSKNNPIIKKYSSLKIKKFREKYGLFLIEGEKMVREAVKSGVKIENIILSEGYSGEKYCSDPVIVPEFIFSYIADEKTPQGIMAAAQIPQSGLREPAESALLLDGLQDPGNLGTIIRTANAAGYKEVYLVNCADPYSPKCVRSAMSGLFFAKLFLGGREEVLNLFSGVPIISADMSGEDIFSFSPPKKFVLAIGNEGNGLSDEVRQKSLYTVKIPMDATAESLNAGVSAGIAMYILKHNSKIIH